MTEKPEQQVRDNERETLLARITSASDAYARIEARLESEHGKLERLAFKVEQQIKRIRSTIDGTEETVNLHRVLIRRAGEICTELLRILDQRKRSGEAARSIHKDRGRVLLFAWNILEVELAIGNLSPRSRLGKFILYLVLRIDKYEDRALANQPKRSNLLYRQVEDLPWHADDAEKVLRILSTPRSRRKLFSHAYLLLRSILRLAARLLPGKHGASFPVGLHVRAGLFLLRTLMWLRRKVYTSGAIINLNESDWIRWVNRDDAILTRIMGSPVSILHDFFRSKHQMLRWNAAVKGIIDEFQQLHMFQHALAEQESAVQTLKRECTRCSTTFLDATARYERMYGHPWQPEQKTQLIIPASASPQPSIPKKSRRAPVYTNKTERQQSVIHDERHDYHATRETRQWLVDLDALPHNLRHLFSQAASSISRKESRKPLGRCDGRWFYSIPVGEAGRIVYSIDAGIALLERAFGPASREEYRKYRKDVQKSYKG